MPGSVKIGGAFKTIATPSVKIGGAWKTVNAGFTRIGGAWKQWFSASQPAYEHIATTVLTAVNDTIEFTGLDSYASEYKHLQIRYTARSTTATNDMFLRFNGITTSSYSRHLLQGSGSSLTSANQTTQTSIFLPIGMSRSSAATGAFGGGIIDILDAFSTTKNTTTRAITGTVDSQTAIGLHSGLFISTAAITTILIRPSSSNFEIGSRFSIYGIRG